MARAPRTAGVTATIAVLTALVVGAWAYGGDGSDRDTPRDHTVYGDPRLPKSVKAPPTLAETSGEQVVDVSGSVSEVADEDVLSDVDLRLLRPGVERISALVTDDDGLIRGTWLFTLKPRQEPHELVNDIALLYESVGYQPVETPFPQVVALRLIPPPGTRDPITYRAHYPSKLGVVRVEAFGANGPAVDKAFTELLATQVGNVPAVP